MPCALHTLHAQVWAAVLPWANVCAFQEPLNATPTLPWSCRFLPWLFVESHDLAHPRLTPDSQHPWALPRAQLHMTWNIMVRGGQDSRQRDHIPFRGPINSLTQHHPHSHSFTRCQIYKVLTCRQGSPRRPLMGFLPKAPFTFQKSGARLHPYLPERQGCPQAPDFSLSCCQPSASAPSLRYPALAPSLSPQSQPPTPSFSLQPPASASSLSPQPLASANSLQYPASTHSPQPPASVPRPRLKRSRNSIWGHLQKAIPPQPHTKETTTSQAD